MEHPVPLEVEVRVLAERVTNLLNRLEEDRGARQALESRVAKLEGRMAFAWGAATFTGAVLGWAGNYLLAVVTK